MNETVNLTIPCPDCGAAIPRDPGFCPHCSRDDAAATRPTRKTPAVLPEFSAWFRENFEFQEVIGSGGMGTVVRAHQKNLGRDVCIKILKMSDREAQERFLEEGRLLAKVRHPRVIQVHFLQIDNNVPYMVCEFVEGVSLREYMDRRNPMEIDEALEIGLQILEGLEAAHSFHVIHRDIKPENILVENAPEKGAGKASIKLLDFGLARSTKADMRRTSSGMLIGTPSYMAPEQINSAETGPYTDLYSTGILIFEMLTGRLPFMAATPFEILSHHVNTTPPSVTGFNPELPPALNPILHKALAKVPGDRYQTAGEFRQELEGVLTRVRATRARRTGTMAATGRTATEATPSRRDTLVFRDGVLQRLSKRLKGLTQPPRSRGGRFIALGAVLALGVGTWKYMETLRPAPILVSDPSVVPTAPPSASPSGPPGVASDAVARKVLVEAVKRLEKRDEVREAIAETERLVDQALSLHRQADLGPVVREALQWATELADQDRVLAARELILRIQFWDPKAEGLAALESRVEKAIAEGKGKLVARFNPARDVYHTDELLTIDVYIEQDGFLIGYLLEPDGMRNRIYPPRAFEKLKAGTKLRLPVFPPGIDAYRCEKPGKQVAYFLLSHQQLPVPVDPSVIEEKGASLDSWLQMLDSLTDIYQAFLIAREVRTIEVEPKTP